MDQRNVALARLDDFDQIDISDPAASVAHLRQPPESEPHRHVGLRGVTCHMPKLPADGDPLTISSMNNKSLNRERHQRAA